MKKTISILLCLVLTVGMFAACGQGCGSGMPQSGDTIEASSGEEFLGASILDLYAQLGPYVEGEVIEGPEVLLQNEYGYAVRYGQFRIRTDDGVEYTFLSGDTLPGFETTSSLLLGIRYRFYYGGELNQSAPQEYYLLDYVSSHQYEDGQQDYVIGFRDAFYETFAELENPAIISPGAAMRAVIAEMGYEDMIAVSNGYGDIEYTNGQLLVRCTTILLEGFDRKPYEPDCTTFEVECRNLSTDETTCIAYVSIETGEAYCF
ncbi:hypothetical protein LJB77_03305 [Ruminococcaceae bacterium OttesenSCG-928-N02]|nr:hypothetical protein [Ruminococcaceae bacterium OttesenSCG-928-N02]